MKRIKLYIAMSLDGYIATRDGDIKWLSTVEGEGDNGYFAFFSSIDTVVMGRLTYEWILKNNTHFPYAQQKCYVVTSKKMPSIGNVHFIEGSFKEMARKLRKDSEKDICLIGGAQLFDGFL
ncbi:dihydrofolate reductase family protein [Kurthia senegalensis]|uniref:dihydrofolate reductase family protein n=1 Tax=Kurthia senegalensis TaxID=1033740 RepID=UPI000288AD4A|nr:dihydrofolate reductase family protein [Kurthia senegalensis]